MHPHPISVCVIGGGVRAAEHAQAMRLFPNLRLAGVFDPSHEPAKHWLTKLHVPYFNDLELMLWCCRPQFALVSVPHDQHMHVVALLAKHGVDIMKEKPLARGYREGRAMLDVVRQAGVRMFVTMQRRFSGIYGLVPEQLKHLGELRQFRCEYTLTVQEPCAGWRGSKERAGGGCILDMGYHVIDEVIWFFGMPDSIKASFQLEPGSEVENEAVIELSYASGLKGEIFVSRNSAPKRERIVVEGEHGSLEADRQSVSRYDCEGALAFGLADRNDWDGVLERQIRGFLQQVETRCPSQQATEHLDHAAFVEACYLSQASGLSVNPHELCTTKEGGYA